jgi:outer membrane protein assembly factor BamD (BamD/ComL family)
MKKLVLLSILTVALAGCAGTDNAVVADLPLADIYTKAYDEFNDKNYEEAAAEFLKAETQYPFL